MQKHIGLILLVALGIPAAFADQEFGAAHLRDNPILLELTEKLRNSPTQPDWKTAKTYVIQDGDTLNVIIDNYMGHLPLRRDILRTALVQINPHAFKRGNPNWMFRGAKLKIPTIADIERVIFTTPLPEAKDPQKNRSLWVRYP